MNRQEFDPEKLRVVGRLAWMKDGDEGHWFSVPSSNDQLIFSEDCIYAHSLTGVRIEIIEIHGYRGAAEVHRWRGPAAFHYGDVSLAPKFSDMCEWGEELYEALVRDGLELWSADPDAIFQWLKRKVVQVRDDAFKVVTRAELRKQLQEEEERDRQITRDWNRRREAELAPKRAARKELQEARTRWRKTPEYDAVFTQVLGKPQSDVTPDDPYQIIYCAHRITEYRLQLVGIGEQEAA